MYHLTGEQTQAPEDLSIYSYERTHVTQAYTQNTETNAHTQNHTHTQILTRSCTYTQKSLKRLEETNTLNILHKDIPTLSPPYTRSTEN